MAHSQRPARTNRSICCNVLQHHEEDILGTIFGILQGGIMRTVIAITSVVILIGTIVAGAVVSHPARAQGTATHPLVTKAEYERWQKEWPITESAAARNRWEFM